MKDAGAHRSEDDLMNFVQAAIDKDKVPDSDGDGAFDPFNSLLPANQSPALPANQNEPLLPSPSDTLPANTNQSPTSNPNLPLNSQPNINPASNSENTS